MTNIGSIKQEGVIIDVTDENSNISIIQADFPQKDIDSDYPLYILGLFATDDSDNEILYSVQTKKYPDYMAKSTNANVLSIYLRTIVGNNANVNVQITDAGTVTTGMLDSRLEDYVTNGQLDKVFETKLPTNIMDLDTNQTITASKNFTTPPTINGIKIATINDLNNKSGQPGIYYTALKNGATGILTGTATPTEADGVQRLSFSGKVRLYLNALTGTDGNSAYVPSNDITDKTYSFITNLDDGFLGVTKYNVNIAALSNTPYPIANQDLAYQRVPAYNDSGSFVGMIVVMVNHGTNDSFGIGLHATTWLSDNITGSGINFRVQKQLPSGNYTLDFANSAPIKMWN